MTHPIKIPNHVGMACWENDRPDQLLQWVARVDAADASSFLACHSPIPGIDSREGSKSETEVFDWLFKRTSLETLIVVTGEPGSGKSHFINWIKLRLDDALAREEMSKIKSVMIKRRSGSLRDALEQLVEQLPDFHNYLDPIRAAIASLTGEFARRELCFKLSQLIHQSPVQDRRLRGLHGFFQDVGSQGWLCRDGGAIDRNIQRLISQSRIDEREALPLLEAEDFFIKDPEFLRQIGSSVQELLDNMEAKEQICNLALLHVNSFLRTALEMLTGLGNQTLHQIFRSIRQDLKQQGQSLALFIEDVSTLSALDAEVVNILEPQNDPSLCRLYGVVGMTDQAFHRLPENMQGRINLTLKIKGGDDDGPLLTDSDYVDRFVARYLNALRLNNQNIDRIADYRRQGLDVRLSACEECNIRDKCFKTFGTVEIEEQEIGLFPFRPGTAYRLLHGLIVEGTVRKNPRGLLQQILTPVIETITKGIEKSPASMGLFVEPRQPRDLGSASGRYLGGWNEQSKQRLSYLLWYWTGCETLDQGASILEIIREALSLPSFSQTPPPPPPPPLKKIDNSAEPPTDDFQLQDEPPQYVKFIGLLEKWSSNKDSLKQDATFREVLWPLIKISTPWDEIRQITEPAYSSVAKRDKGVVQIEGMEAKPAIGSSLRFYFARSEETTELLRASLRFHFLGGKDSWNYQDSLQDKRIVGRWLRSNIEQIGRVPDPDKLDPKDTHAVAIRFLIIAYQFSQRKSLPGDYSDTVNELFSFEVVAPPAALSQELCKIAKDLPERVKRVREFLMAELNIQQGTTGGLNFIDPILIIRAVESYNGECSLPKLDERFNESFWAPRFKAVVDLHKSSWSHLEEALIEEIQELNNAYHEISLELSRWDLDAENAIDRLKEFVDGCKDLKLALKETGQALGNNDVDMILSKGGNLAAQWIKTLREAKEITESEIPLDMLRFQTEGLIELRKSLFVLSSWVKELSEIIDKQYNSGTEGEDLGYEINKAHQALDSFMLLTTPIEEEPNVEV